MREYAAGRTVGAGRYTLTRELGRGGMGIVWLAQDGRLGEEVALKFLPAEMAQGSGALENMRSETLKSRRLSHPNIVRIHDLDESPGEAPFISMEYVPGTTVADLKARQPQRLLDWDFLRPLVKQLCDALEYAHGQKVVHRDLKPGNLMVDAEGNLKLADFGLAATATESMTQMSRDLGASGTIVYMSPQQMQSRAPKVSDDIYALGATLYELLTSKPPFYSGDIFRQVTETPAVPMDERLEDLELLNEIPKDVAAMVMACLAKEPDQRPPSAAAVAQWIGLAGGSSDAGLEFLSPVEETESGVGQASGLEEDYVEGGGGAGRWALGALICALGLAAGWFFLKPESPTKNSLPKVGMGDESVEASVVVMDNPTSTGDSPAGASAQATDAQSFAFIGKETPPAQMDASFRGPVFQPYAGLRHRLVSSIAVLPDGKVLVAGLFGLADGAVVNSLARLHPDGALDTNFVHQLKPNEFEGMLALSDGKVLCACRPITGFKNEQPVTSGSVLVRLNPDGSKDDSFPTHLGDAASVSGLVVGRGGSTFVAGWNFRKRDGGGVPSLLRLNAAGRADGPFAARFGQMTIDVAAMPFELEDGRLLLGTISLKSGGKIYGLAELLPDGRRGGIYRPDCCNNAIMTVRVQSDGRILAIGQFTEFEGLHRTGVARLNADGSLDKSYVPPQPSSRSSIQWGDVHVHSDGRALLCGTYIVDGKYYNLVRLNPDGSVDPTLSFAAPSDSVAYDMEFLPDGKLLVAGQFRVFNGRPASLIVRLMYDAAGKDGAAPALK